jgi:hypothetical protein
VNLFQTYQGYLILFGVNTKKGGYFMAECKNLTTCGFIKCCEEFHKENSVNGFINMYCKGDKQSECVRLKLCTKYSKEIVPKNMMPNGYPLPGTTKEGWSNEALNLRNL